MAEITAALVKQLREMTDAPMMECKKALVAVDGDIEKAVDELKRIGLTKAAKKAGRATNEGTIGAYLAEDGKTAALLELSCETDFVGTNPKFTGFAADLAKVVADADPADVDALKAAPMGAENVEAALTEMIHIIGENMQIARFIRRTTDAGAFSSYVHMGGKIGVLVEFAFAKAETAAAEAFKTFAHDVALQVAAVDPIACTREDVPAEVVEREMAIYKQQAADSGKPEEIQERIATGKLESFYKDRCLVDQQFIKDGSVTITDLAKKVSKELGDDIKVVAFERMAFGE